MSGMARLVGLRTEYAVRFCDGHVVKKEDKAEALRTIAKGVAGRREKHPGCDWMTADPELVTRTIEIRATAWEPKE